MGKRSQNEWSIDEMRVYVEQLAIEHGMQDRIDDDIILRVCTIAQASLDVGLFLLFSEEDPEASTALNFTTDLRLLSSNYINHLFAVCKQHKNFNHHEHIDLQG